MLDVTQLRNGTVFKYEGEPYVVVSYEHRKPGRGNAIIRVKIRGLKNGVVKEVTFTSGAKVEDAEVVRKKEQFLYSNQGTGEVVFMDQESYEQINLKKELIGDQVKYLKEGDEVWLLVFEGDPISVEIPPHVKLKVVETEQGIKGDSVSNVYKPAKLETGIILQVPLFVKVGDVVEVDTRTGEYVGRV